MSPKETPPAGWVKGVDASYAELTPAIVAELRAAGVEIWWQCLWTGVERPPFAIANLRVALDAGLEIAAYGSVTRAQPGWWHAEHTRDGVPDDLWDELLLVPCDVELEGVHGEQIRDFLNRMSNHDKRNAIYTSIDAWGRVALDGNEFTDCLLCNAYWDADPDVDFAAHPYGGWRPDQVVLEQYTGGTVIAGIEVDRDVWNRELLFFGTGEALVDAPTKGEFGALFAYAKATHDTAIAVLDALITLAQHVYGDDEPRLVKLRADFDTARATMADASTAATAAAAGNAPPAPT